ncbi:MAG: DUF4391 domain-containing protein [Rhodanobacteraceae bacterium]
MPPRAQPTGTDARAVLFDYPERAAVGTVIPKARILARARTRGLRDRLSAQVAEIRWAYKLAPVSLNLSASAELPEFQIFRVTLKSGVESIAEPLLRAIDQAVPSPILFEVLGETGIRTVAAYKRPSEADSTKEVLGDYLWGDPLPPETPRQPLPVALDMAGLYRELLRRLIPLPARAGESLRDQLDRLAQVHAAERECVRLEAQLAREKQFNRKVEINRHLREARRTLHAARSSGSA